MVVLIAIRGFWAIKVAYQVTVQYKYDSEMMKVGKLSLGLPRLLTVLLFNLGTFKYSKSLRLALK